MRRLSSFRYRMLNALAAALLLAVSACSSGSASTPSHDSAGLQAGHLPGETIWKNRISSFLFGTTDTYEWSDHNLQTEPAIQQALKDAGFTVVRSFFPDNATDAVIEKRVQTIENTGARCLGVIPNIHNQTFNEHLVRYLGSRCQMYEFGGEPDYNGISAADFVAAWNKTIPALRSINPAAKFFGPTTSYPNYDYIKQFLQGVKASNVLPDSISIDYYPCWHDTKEGCLAKAGDYGNVAHRTRELAQSVLGRDIPISFTEWNYDPGNPPPAYGDDAAFITEFTAAALQSMMAAHVELAAQFDAASYSGYGRLDMFDINTNQPKPQYSAIAGLIKQYRLPADDETQEGSGASQTASAPGSLISRGKPAYCSSSNSGPGGPGVLVDGHFGDWAFWQLATSDLPGWCAVKLGTGPSRILMSWMSDYNFDYIDGTGLGPQDYTISTSSDSTNGADGTWHTIATVTGNHARMREHLVPFAGMSWVKMTVTAGQPHMTQPYIRIDELEAQDVSQSLDNTFIFVGDSITAFAYDRFQEHQPSFAEDVHAAFPNRFPLMLDAGMSGWDTSGAVKNIDDWLALNPDMHYWLIGWGGADALETADPSEFRVSLQALVDKIQHAGHVPVIARIRYSNLTTVGLDKEIQSLNAVIDQVTAANGLIAGPDFYALYRQHPNYLAADGIHPTDVGAVAMNQAWFQALRRVFTTS